MLSPFADRSSTSTTSTDTNSTNKADTPAATAAATAAQTPTPTTATIELSSNCTETLLRRITNVVEKQSASSTALIQEKLQITNNLLEKNNYQDKIQALDDKYQGVVENLQNEYQVKIEGMERRNELIIQTMEKKYEEKMKALEERMEVDRQSHQEKIQHLENKYKVVQDVANGNQERLTVFEDKYGNLQRLENEHMEKLKNLQGRNQIIEDENKQKVQLLEDRIQLLKHKDKIEAADSILNVEESFLKSVEETIGNPTSIKRNNTSDGSQPNSNAQNEGIPSSSGSKSLQSTINQNQSSSSATSKEEEQHMLSTPTLVTGYEQVPKKRRKEGKKDCGRPIIAGNSIMSLVASIASSSFIPNQARSIEDSQPHSQSHISPCDAMNERIPSSSASEKLQSTTNQNQSPSTATSKEEEQRICMPSIPTVITGFEEDGRPIIAGLKNKSLESLAKTAVKASSSSTSNQIRSIEDSASASSHDVRRTLEMMESMRPPPGGDWTGTVFLPALMSRTDGRPRRSGSRAPLKIYSEEVAPARISIGDDVYSSDCKLTIKYSNFRIHSIHIQYDCPTKLKSQHHLIAVSEISEVKHYSTKGNLSEWLVNDDDQMSFLAMKITPNDSNKLPKELPYLNNCYVVIEMGSNEDLNQIIGNENLKGFEPFVNSSKLTYAGTEKYVGVLKGYSKEKHDHMASAISKRLPKLKGGRTIWNSNYESEKCTQRKKLRRGDHHS